MSKQSGLGANYYLDQYDLSNDTNSLGNISKKMSLLEFTGIDKLAQERQSGDLDSEMKWVSYFNPTNAHAALSSLPRTDRQASYFHRAALGAPVASMLGKQVGYDLKRDADGKLMADVDVPGNGTWLDWGYALTAGKRTDATATNGTGVDLNAQGFGFTTSAAFGAQAYLHVFAFTGTSVTIKIQDSADNATFADLTGGTFTLVTGVGPQRIITGRTQTVRRYLRVITSGTFSNVVFAVQATVNITDMTI
jgi:hypothetical protein